jgi:hypothetical protein
MLASAWITVAITLERFVSIAYPMKAAIISTKKNARIIIATIYTICFGLVLYIPFRAGVQVMKSRSEVYYSVCTYYNKEEYDIWYWVTIRAGSLIVPSVIIIVVTAMIIYMLQKMARARRQMSMQQSQVNVQRQLTVMLVLVAVTFLLLRLPFLIVFFIYYYHTYFTNISFDHIWAAVKMCDVLTTCNYAINFFLFFLSGSVFRKHFVALICCRKEKAKALVSNQTLSTSLKSMNKLSPLPVKRNNNLNSQL